MNPPLWVIKEGEPWCVSVHVCVCERERECVCVTSVSAICTLCLCCCTLYVTLSVSVSSFSSVGCGGGLWHHLFVIILLRMFYILLFWTSVRQCMGKSEPQSQWPLTFTIIIMYIYHVLINALSAHIIHINLNMIFYTINKKRNKIRNLWLWLNYLLFFISNPLLPSTVYKRERKQTFHYYTAQKSVWSFVKKQAPYCDNADRKGCLFLIQVLYCYTAVSSSSALASPATCGTDLAGAVSH